MKQEQNEKTNDTKAKHNICFYAVKYKAAKLKKWTLKFVIW